MLLFSDNRKFPLLQLRPVQAADEDFLRHLYYQVHHQDFDLADSAQHYSILDLQFSARQQHYGLQFPHAQHWIIVSNTVAIGQLRVARTAQEIRLVDISLLPSHQNLGIGTELLRQLQVEATKAQLPLRLSVVQSNLRALRLYRRLGFQVIDAAAPYLFMEWQPAIYGADSTSCAGD